LAKESVLKIFSGKRRKLFAAAAACIVVLVGIEIMLVPVALKKLAVRELSKFLGRSVAIQGLDFNPIAMSLTLHGMQVGEPGGGNIFSADTFHVKFELLSSLVHHTFVFKEASLYGPRFTVARNTDGTLNFADLLLLNWPKLIAFRVDLMRMVDATVHFRDSALPSPFSTTISHLTATVENFSTSPEQKNTFSVSAVTESGERFSTSGFFRFDPLSASGVIAAENVRMQKYSPYIAKNLDLEIVDGTLTARASFDLDLNRSRFTGLLYDATIDSRSLKVHELGSDTPLFGFADLAVTGAAVDLVRSTIGITSIAATGVTAAITRRDDGSFNVQHILKPVPALPAMPASASAGWSVHAGEIRLSDFAAVVSNVFGKETLDWKELRISEPAFRMNPFAASVDAVTLRDGKLEFTDPSLEPAVRMALTDLNVQIGGFSSDNPRAASVAVHARIESAAPLQISGETNPISESGTASIRGLLQNADLLPLGPYASKYLGYELAAGDLSLDTTMVMQNNRLETKNRIEIDRLSLGRRTESKDATDLPVQLAIALLKDSRGRIILNLPIDLDLRDPAFDPRKAIIDAVLHPFKKAAEFPFAAFGAQLGDGGDELGFQKFSTGSADLIPLEAEKLDTILQGMARWPELVLDVEGSVDGAQDKGDLQLLAANRAKVVQAYLSRPGSVEPGRIFLIVHSLETVPRKGSLVFLSLRDKPSSPVEN
jgi:hypothetical protein